MGKEKPDFHGIQKRKPSPQTTSAVDAKYKAVFMTLTGQEVLTDLTRVANRTPINADSPNPNSAIYRIAQQDLIKYILNKLKAEEHD